MSESRELKNFADELAKTLPYLIRFSNALISGPADPLTQGKITLPQYVCLDLLNSRRQFKMHELAAELRISFPAVTGLVARLVKMKMVERVYDQSDRRVIYIVLSPLGKKMVEKVKAGRQKIIEKIFAELTDKEREVYLNIIRKIKKTLYDKNKNG